MTTYILFVFLWSAPGSTSNSGAAITHEFNSKEACQLAAKEVQRQAQTTRESVIFCAPK